MNKKKAFVWAVAVAAGLLVTTFGVTHSVTKRPVTVTAQFEDSVGLYAGNPVSVLGMPVGSVRSIVPKSSYVEVTLAIDHGVNIPADVQAVTVSTSILTDRHVELTPPYRGGPKLKDGDVVGLGRTRTPVEFDRTLNMIDKLASALRGDGGGAGPVADLINIGAQATDGSGPQLRATLDQLSQALRLGSDDGAGTKKDIQSIATSLAALTQKAADNDAAIREFGAALRQLSEILADERLGSGATGAKINQILGQTTSVLERNRDALKSTVGDARTITQALIDNQRELAEFFDLAPMTVDNVANAIDANAGVVRVHALSDKLLLQSQFGKEICNLIGKKQLGCATGTLRDYGPDFGLTGMLNLMAGVQP